MWNSRRSVAFQNGTSGCEMGPELLDLWALAGLSAPFDSGHRRVYHEVSRELHAAICV